MNPHLRVPAWRAPQPAPAAALGADPAPRLAAMYRRAWEAGMRDMPFVNPALAVEAVGFRRWRGDWLGAVITPWFLNLFILPGGGELWSDRPAGERCRIVFPVGELEFIADHDSDPAADVPAYQYCPLFAPVGQFATQAVARSAAYESLNAVLTPQPAPPAALAAASPPAPERAERRERPERLESSRRAFLRRVAGR